MRARASRPLLRSERSSSSAGLVLAIMAVAAITALIFPLREISPAESNGVAYLLAVLLVSTIWGLRLGLFTSVVSAAAFNFFHLPPTGQLHDRREPALGRARRLPRRGGRGQRGRRVGPLARERGRATAARGGPGGGARADPARRPKRRRHARRRGAAARGGARTRVGGDRARAPGDRGDGLAFELMRGERPIGALVVARRGRAVGARASARACACRRSRRCSRPPWSATGCRPRWSRRARCGAATSSRRRCCAPSRTTCGRR